MHDIKAIRDNASAFVRGLTRRGMAEAQAAARQFAELLRTLPERLRGIENFDLNIEALSAANVAGHAVSAVDAATWQVASSADISGPD